MELCCISELQCIRIIENSIVKLLHIHFNVTKQMEIHFSTTLLKYFFARMDVLSSFFYGSFSIQSKVKIFKRFGPYPGVRFSNETFLKNGFKI